MSGTTSTTDAPDPSARSSLSRDEMYHLLQNKRRRAVLRYLLSRDDRDQFDMPSVAKEVAAWEHDTLVRHLESSERQRVYIALYQSHLPKLDEHGVVDYDQSRGLITVRPLAERLRPFLDVEAGLDAPETISVDRADGERRPGDDSSGATGDGLLARLGLRTG